MATGNLTAHPGKYLKGDYSFDSIRNETNPVGKGVNNTTCANLYLKTGRQAETWVYWPFDLSAIPDDATIDEVSCSVNADRNDAHISVVATVEAQLYTGTKAKGSATGLYQDIGTLPLSCGTWKRSELQNCRLRLYAKRGSSDINSSQRIYFYGADVTVTYTYKSGEKFLLKLGGSWAGASTTYKKVNGIWVEQTDLANVIEDGARYKNGGEYVPPIKTVTITGRGLTYGGNTPLGVVINGVTYAQPATIEVDAGTVIQVHAGEVYLNGVVVPSHGSIYSHTVNENCTINLEANFTTNSLKATITTK